MNTSCKEDKKDEWITLLDYDTFKQKINEGDKKHGERKSKIKMNSFLSNYFLPLKGKNCFQKQISRIYFNDTKCFKLK